MTAPCDLDLLAGAARAVGEVALHYRQRAPKVWQKPDGGGPVSEADLEIDATLRAHLMAARPDYGWLSEETPDAPDRLVRERVFIVDPLDGTRAYLAGETGFAHALAVAEAGRVIAGVVFLPALGRLYTATADGPALCDGAPITASGAQDPDGARMLARRVSLDPHHWPGGVPDVTRTHHPSLAHRLCLVAEGVHDAMLSFRATWEWDIAAGALIAQAAGVSVTNRAGAPLRFNAAHPQVDGIVAAPGALHGRLLTRMGVASAA